eukprot:TRINITY_DN31344_c0_g1_i1.p1 TRINITY_DN31344_c0_g1~~TRINITY_DN31344_c0_g1_i1.p1  ORF type:complete len:888 (-),score=206.07 TRINITY_DN31344_c0_g1_i1:161-2824(-)
MAEPVFGTRCVAYAVLFGVQPVLANWLLQCSSCVDQAYYGDTLLKENVKDADLSVLLAQIKQVRLRSFDHKEDEFYNKFFSKRQLGVVTQEVQSVMPSAVAHLPERRWTNAKGMSNMTKNVMLLRESQLLFAALGSLQLLARRADYWDATIDKLEREMVEVLQEQNDNRRKREELLEQIVRVIAKIEVIQHALTKTEQAFVKLDTQVGQFKEQQQEKHAVMQQGLDDVRNKTEAQDERIATFMADFRSAVDREARADLVEKRKAAEAGVEISLVKRSIEKLRWEEEQKTIQLREKEKRESDGHSSKLHQERVAHELAKKKEADLQLMQAQEESNMRQEEARVKGERELLLLKLESEEKRAEIDVQKAIEQAKIESEAKIRERRENEDVHTRFMQAEQIEKRQQMLDAIKATAEIARQWVANLYGSPYNLMLGLGSIIAALAGAYFSREMAILLREQLNKRLGRPSLVRSTNRRDFMQELRIGFLRFLRMAPPKGAEFSDVVLHPKLHQQVMRLADATQSAKKRGMPLQHAMFYGPPGTGKTMVAQRFAEYSGLEYAIMSGGDVAPLEEQAVTELHKLFKWVHRSRRGVLLFIDEADAFLASRKGGNMSEALRNALTTMLYHTGTQSSQFMLVIATNRPGDLDSAVLDRVDECVEFGLPEVNARLDMIGLYFKEYITKPLGIRPLLPQDDPNEPEPPTGIRAASLAIRDTARKFAARVAAGVKRKGVKDSSPAPSCGAATPAEPRTASVDPVTTPQADKGPTTNWIRREDLCDEIVLAEVAKKIHGFSGREIAKMFLALQTHILYSSRKAVIKRYLPKTIMLEVIEQKVSEHDRTVDFQASGYNYVHLERTTPLGTPLTTPNGARQAPKLMGRHPPNNGEALHIGNHR